MRKLAVFACIVLLPLVGCSLVRDLVAKSGVVPGPAPEIVAPPSLLEGRAALFQDSLKPRLDWLVTHPPKGWNAGYVAFQNDPDTSRPVFLLLETTEGSPLNAHRKSPVDLAKEEARRILRIKPWRREAAESKIDQPLHLRVVYRYRDFMRSSSRFTHDTVVVRYQDSSATWRGAPLGP